MAGLEHAAALAEAAEAEPLDPQPLLQFRQLGHPLQRAHRVDQRVEQVEQDEQDVIVEVQLAVAGPVPTAPGVMQVRQLRSCLKPRRSSTATSCCDDDDDDDDARIAMPADHARQLTIAQARQSAAPSPGANGVPNGIGGDPFS
jgi:hypothetical protein